MGRIKLYIKKKILSMVDIHLKPEFSVIHDNLEAMDSTLNSSNNKLKKSIVNYNDSLRNMNEIKELLNSMTQIGIDINPRHPEDNWAVICIGGNKDYVKFIDLSQKNIYEIQQFLKGFEKRNVKIDAPSHVELIDLYKW